ncbi:hypothetical protein [Curtobacterium ammoniigenes]|uniref:hypothetical protein n=1 Tax=Curtobacterium ammoniigenes TaxID=395387 RepID=UPI000AB2F19B|nr:hypothetical protein [Curtobacterium ammoniigenes]
MSAERRPRMRRGRAIDREPWHGPVREYDLLKELVIGVSVVGVLVLGLAALLGSPDDRAVTLRDWATAAPADFVATATAELGGTSDTAQYGPPYTTGSGSVQTIAGLSPQQASGVRIPIDTARDFVILPLQTAGGVGAAVRTWNVATASQQSAWTRTYAAALAKAPGGNPLRARTAGAGPVPALTSSLEAMAKTGALDAVIRAEQGPTSLDATRTVLFLGDGTWFPDLAQRLHLTGDQWGVMNETGNYPGQAWLWLFSLWYQIPAIAALSNADIVAVGLIGLCSILLLLVPFIPGLRDIPRLVPLHRVIWRTQARPDRPVTTIREASHV